MIIVDAGHYCLKRPKAGEKIYHWPCGQVVVQIKKMSPGCKKHLSKNKCKCHFFFEIVIFHRKSILEQKKNRFLSKKLLFRSVLHLPVTCYLRVTFTCFVSRFKSVLCQFHQKSIFELKNIISLSRFEPVLCQWAQS